MQKRTKHEGNLPQTQRIMFQSKEQQKAQQKQQKKQRKQRTNHLPNEPGRKVYKI